MKVQAIEEIDERPHGGDFIASLLLWLLFVLLLWGIRFLETVMNIDLHWLGVLPRDVNGLTGILTSPLIHADFSHLFSNTIPLLVLGIGIIYFYRKIAFRVIAIVFLMEGILVWLTARPDYHIGASGLNYGFAAFLFLSGIVRRHRGMMALSLLIVFLYGGMIWGILPIENTMSWESHMAGALAGAVAAVVYRKEGYQFKRSELEEADEAEDDMPSISSYREIVPPDRARNSG